MWDIGRAFQDVIDGIAAMILVTLIIGVAIGTVIGWIVWG